MVNKAYCKPAALSVGDFHFEIHLCPTNRRICGRALIEAVSRRHGQPRYGDAFLDHRLECLLTDGEKQAVHPAEQTVEDAAGNFVAFGVQVAMLLLEPWCVASCREARAGPAEFPGVVAPHAR